MRGTLTPGHRDLQRLATGHVAGLNQLLVTPGRTPLLGADGAPIDLGTGRFGRPVRAVELATGVPGKDATAWSSFVDGAYLSPFVPRGASVPTAWALVVGIEVKRPGASGALTRQLGEHLDRLVGRNASFVRWRLPDGTESDPLAVDRLVFSQQYRDLVGASGSLTGTPEYRFVSTDRGGYDEFFLRYDLVMDTSGIDDLSAALFRLVGR